MSTDLNTSVSKFPPSVCLKMLDIGKRYLLRSYDGGDPFEVIVLEKSSTSARLQYQSGKIGWRHEDDLGWWKFLEELPISEQNDKRSVATEDAILTNDHNQK